MSLGSMTLATSTTPYYFKPATIKDDLYISGDSIAMSPAMHAFLHANEKNGIAIEDITVVSVGAINELAEKIDTESSLLDWALRLTSLNAPVKKHTMDYILKFFLETAGCKLYKFEIDKSRDSELEFYWMSSRKE